MSRIKAILLYFVIVLGTGFALGLIRVPFLVPRLGERYAELLEMPIRLVVIVLGARHVVSRFKIAPVLAARLQVGFAALALSVAAELLLATVLQSQSLAQYIASRDPVSGAVYLVLLLVFALMPALLTYIPARHSPASNR
jgi:vancomycin permeability regulator SanA